MAFQTQTLGGFQQVGGGGSAAAGGSSSLVQTWANSTGNTTILRNGANQIDVVTVTGTAGTRIFVIGTAGAASGDVHTIRFQLPATASIVIEIRNATAGGTLLYSYTTDGGGDDGLFEVYFDGTAWAPLSNIVPVV